ncbi:MAG: DNA mismatch repair protein MutL, partial [Cyclobacteriaceae bacterium]|nr:DNA mismatch repair protein MutL [Cyclobacteriaceae bacterium]
VNVHPTKTEIKFDDERTVYSIVRSAVKQALGIHNITPSLNFSADINLIEQIERKNQMPDKYYSQFRNTEPHGESNIRHWEKLYDENLLEGSREVNRIVEREGESPMESMIFSSNANVENTKGDNAMGIMLTCEDFILTNMKSGLMVIDRRAAVERIVYEKYVNNAKNNRAPSQQCLFPYTLELSASDFELINDIGEELKGLGFVFEVFGRRSIVIQGIPADIVNENEKDLLEGLIEQFKNSKDELDLSGREKIIRALARKTAAKSPKRLSKVEMEEVVSGLFACANPNNAPDGRPTFKILERKTIEGFFK